MGEIFDMPVFLKYFSLLLTQKYVVTTIDKIVMQGLYWIKEIVPKASKRALSSSTHA